MNQVLSCIPMCLSSVYKEKALGDDDMDVVYLNGWVAVFQFMASLLFAVSSPSSSSLSESTATSSTVSVVSLPLLLPITATNLKRKQLPTPGSLSTSTKPPNSAAMRRQLASPRPIPRSYVWSCHWPG